MKPIVAYYRVSTKRQGRSRLGVDAQRERCAQFAAANGMELAEAFTEVETGMGSNALDRRPARRGPGRRAALPRPGAGGQARPALARRPLHRRTDGVAGAVPGGRARRRRGPVHAAHLRGAGHPERVGAQVGNQTNLAAAQATGSARTAAAALRFAENTAPVIQQVRTSGVTSLRGIARILNARGVRAARGGTWAATQVGAVLMRAVSNSPAGSGST